MQLLVGEAMEHQPTLQELQAFADTKLAAYKKLKESLATAYDGYEEQLIEEKLEAYRTLIKSTKAKIREMQSHENVVA